MAEAALLRFSENHRDRVVAFLAFLTSDACLAACRTRVGAERLAAALCRLWFDEIYVPGAAYLGGLKADRAPAAIAAFENCFSLDELDTLERFHGCLELRLDLAVNRAHGRAFIPENDSWRSLRRDAASLLADLAPDADHLREALAALVNALLGEAPALLDGERKE